MLSRRRGSRLEFGDVGDCAAESCWDALPALAGGVVAVLEGLLPIVVATFGKSRYDENKKLNMSTKPRDLDSSM